MKSGNRGRSGKQRDYRNLRVYIRAGVSAGLISFALAFSAGAYAQGPSCGRTVKADVVALDQVFFWNRYGAMQPQGMIYSLRKDIVPIDQALGLVPGNVRLRSDRRPRPLVLRVNAGDCIEIQFQNLLNPTRVDDEQAATRDASIHVIGMQPVNSILDDGSNVGQNPSSLAAPGQSRTYTLYAEAEKGLVMYSTAAQTGGEGDGGTLNAGLFGAINVEPAGAVWYRSQVTHNDMQFATIGQTPDGHPIINFDAVYPAGHPFADVPVLRMLDDNLNIVHGDLTAIIAGPQANGEWPHGTFAVNRQLPERWQPFREFTIIYHDEIGAYQAFDQFRDPVLGFTLTGVRDGFAINYGTGGLGAELIANRIGVGPVFDCIECKYEEFFLTSWVVGDPASIVDIPANADLDGDGVPDPGPKATKVLYADDPSNVYHGYISDHVKFRIMHGGSKEHHIHHQHTMQWVRTPDAENSSYLDSQALGPGAGFTLETTYNGSGNKNQAVGDSIFHCHFYPHFAQGMWSLWRVHDVFEIGSQLDVNGRPVAGTRALPDAEIAAGTPIPALVPLPGRAMAPLPAAQVTIVAGLNGQPGGQVTISPLPGETAMGNPGYPFFVPGIAGHRPPHPPLDTLDDGGLPRHIILSDPASVRVTVETRLDFTAEIHSVRALEIPESGSPVEVAAMEFHEQRLHPSCLPDGTCDASVDPSSTATVNFIANGLPRASGAPFAYPCLDMDGNAIGKPRLYKAADIQIDAILNKGGWHFPQQRMVSLWGDVASIMDGTRAPEPLFFRANSDDCIEYQLTNLIPNIYEMDDFQVRTPTDIIGQHIHLVKFDVTSSDGSGNGWNYEDGSFSPDEVRERIDAIRVMNSCLGDGINGGDPRDGDNTICPVAKAHPYFGPGPDGKWLGAQTTIQRWFADRTLNVAGTKDRTLRTVFTHDHFGPSTHQQAALYCGLVIEPEDSIWRLPEDGTILGGRFDGGPTSWHADILTPNTVDSYREFLLEFSDFQLAYQPGSQASLSLPSGGGPTFPLPWHGTARLRGEGFDDPAYAINPPGRVEADIKTLFLPPDECPGGVAPPCPEAISAEDPGTMTVNYRNETIAQRVYDPNSLSQASGNAGDLAMVFRSDVTRADPDFNVQPNFYPPLTPGLNPGDPYTPLLRAYQGDKVQVRVLVGGQEEGHNFSMNGVKWFSEPDWPDSGYKNSQFMGISEHFEFAAPIVPTKNVKGPFSDYLWAAGSSVDDLWNGLWGIMRAYRSNQSDLLPLPNNPPGGPTIKNGKKFNGACPRGAPTRKYDISAVSAATALEGGELIYNFRSSNGGPLVDPTGALYVRSSDLKKRSGKLKPGVPVEPLVLRAAAGECLTVTLRNKLPAVMPELDGWSSLPMIINRFNANHLNVSSQVGLHPQLIAYDVTRDDGNNVGMNGVQTAGPGNSVTYRWYLGDLSLDAAGNMIATPVEFGISGLIPADRIKQAGKGLVGALVIEPEGSTWVEDLGNAASVGFGTRTSATVTLADGSSFREFVLVLQNDVNLRFADGTPIANLAGEEDPEDSGQKAVNYRTDPMWFRMGFDPDTVLNGGHGEVPGPVTNDVVFTDALSNSLTGGFDPATPVFVARVGDQVRFRVVEPGGHQRNTVFTLHGHIWQEDPYTNDGTRMGFNPLSQYQGARMGIGATTHFNALLADGAGGKFGIPGDYLWRDFSSFSFDGGVWGILRVLP